MFDEKLLTSPQEKATFHHLQIALGAAVPLWAHRIQNDPEPYFARSELDRILLNICEHGEKLFYRSAQRRVGDRVVPGTAQIFNDTAQSIATLAFCPGGIHIFGLHFEFKLDEHILKRPEVKETFSKLKQVTSVLNKFLQGGDTKATNDLKRFSTLFASQRKGG